MWAILDYSPAGRDPFPLGGLYNIKTNPNGQYYFSLISF